MALPPEKTDSLGSGDEKRMEKLSEPGQASKKQLKFEVSFLLRAVTLQWCSRKGKLRPIRMGGAVTSCVDNCFWERSFLLQPWPLHVSGGQYTPPGPYCKVGAHIRR